MPETTQRPIELSLDDALALELFEVTPKQKLRAFKMEQPFQVMTRYRTLEGGNAGDYIVVVTDENGDDNLEVMRSAAFETAYVVPEEEEPEERPKRGGQRRGRS